MNLKKCYMKKILLMMFAVSLMFAYSCRRPSEPLTFAFKNANVTENSVDITVTPSDLDRDYFLGILSATEADEKDDAQIIAEVADIDAFKKCKGEQSCGLEGLQPETTYVVMAFACDETEKVERYLMTTLASQESEPENPDQPEQPEQPENPEQPEQPVEPEDPEPVLELVADKTEIFNDGVDKVVFTVLSDGNTLSDGYQLLNVESNTPLSNNSFSTTEVGVYTFVAKLDNVISNEVEVNVVLYEEPKPVVRLVPDKNVIKTNGNDKVTFRVWVDDNIKTSESVIYNVTDGVELEGDTFTTDKLGTYVFNATYEGITTEDVTITVVEGRLYSPGDLYEENGVVGVVYYVENGGVNGLIMSMDEAYLQWSTVCEWANCISQRGEWNTEDMLKLGADKYPAAKWCVEHGDGWYMPSSRELQLMWDAVSNGTHEWDKDYVKLYNDKLDDPISEDYYWSSSETSEDMAEVIAFMGNSVVCLDPIKTSKFSVRAVYKF